jgi:tetrapyrrole methylase family protein/MazG family protein
MEETGDLFMLATMVAYISEQSGDFHVRDSLRTVCKKLVRRHPHVFDPPHIESTSSRVDTPDKVVVQWNQIKENVEGRRKKDSILDEVPRHLDPLEKAYKLQKKASKAGFDWPGSEGAWLKIEEELDEIRKAQENGAESEIENEVGDLFFSVVNLARHLGVDPGLAIQRSNEKFSHRFRYVEKSMKKAELSLGPENMDKMDGFWNEAKQLEKKSGN